MAGFMEVKSVNPRLWQDQIAKELVGSSSTLQQYRQDMNMLPPYKIPQNTHKTKQKISNTKLDANSYHEHDLKRPQMTSIYLKTPQFTLNESSPSIWTFKPNKNKLKGGCIFEINDEDLDEIFPNNNL